MSNNNDLSLLKPLNAGSLQLPNRVLMAPLTRLRTLPDLSMRPITEAYYSQRASAGLIISEAIAAAPFGAGYGGMPAFVSETQIASWKKIVTAVHAAGGRIVAQFWHVGRPRLPEDFHDDLPFAAPRNPLMPAELTWQEIEAMPADFARAARTAIDIGFDAVEVHAGNGTLLANSLREDANQRTDKYGGSADNRARLLMNILEAIVHSIGADRVGIKVAPNSQFPNPVSGGKFDPTARKTFSHVLRRLSALGLAYVQVNRVTGSDAEKAIPLAWVREHYSGTLFGADNFGREDGERMIADGVVDAILYGRPFLANPDLPARFATGATLNEVDYQTFYEGGEKGYLDYPTL